MMPRLVYYRFDVMASLHTHTHTDAMIYVWWPPEYIECMIKCFCGYARAVVAVVVVVGFLFDLGGVGGGVGDRSTSAAVL